MTHLPGYGGYRRQFERSYVAHTPIPANKYGDAHAQHHQQQQLMNDDTFHSMYAHTMPKDALDAHVKHQQQLLQQQQQQHIQLQMEEQQQRTQNIVSHEEQPRSAAAAPRNSAAAVSAFSSSSSSNWYPPRSAPASTTLAADAVPSSSASNWTSNYRASHCPSASSSSLAASPPTLTTPIPLSLPAVLSSQPFALNLLRSHPFLHPSAYQRDFGAGAASTTNPSRDAPQCPQDRTAILVENPALPHHKQITAMATSKDLFAGTSKDSIRVPGYTGYIPFSSANRHTIVGDGQSVNGQLTSSSKDNLLIIYRHNIAGYSGHHPRSVINDRGPRTPRGKRRVNEGLVTSLILDSMRV